MLIGCLVKKSINWLCLVSTRYAMNSVNSTELPHMTRRSVILFSLRHSRCGDRDRESFQLFLERLGLALLELLPPPPRPFQEMF